MACSNGYDRSQQAGPGGKSANGPRPAARRRRHPRSDRNRLARCAVEPPASPLEPENKSRFIFRFGTSSTCSLNVNDMWGRHAE
jgi:hypothetical protein